MTPAQFSKAMDLLNHQQNKFGLNPRTISRMKINMPIRDSLKAEIIRARKCNRRPARRYGGKNMTKSILVGLFEGLAFLGTLATIIAWLWVISVLME